MMLLRQKFPFVSTACACAIVGLASAVTLRADWVEWIYPGDGEWDCAGCWAPPPLVPGNGASVWVGGPSTSLTVFLRNKAYPPGMLQVGELSVSGPSGFPSTLSVDLGISNPGL